jgi:hypothetical protein
VESEVLDLAKLHQLRKLVLLGDVVPDTLAGLSALTNLEELFVNFTSGWPTSVGFLADLTRLRELRLINATQVVDFSTLRQMPSLQKIGFPHSPALAWIDEIQHPDQINDVWMGGNEDASTLRKVVTRFPQMHHLRLLYGARPDLAPLRGANVRELFLEDCQDLNIGPLCDMSTLTQLFIRGPSGEIDLSPLADSTLSVFLSPGIIPVGIEVLGPGVTLDQPKA